MNAAKKIIASHLFHLSLVVLLIADCFINPAVLWNMSWKEPEKESVCP